MSTISVVDLAGVVYSAGKVFNGLSTGRLDTENFLRSGSLEGIASRADLELLKDLRDAAQFIIDHATESGEVDAAFVCNVNRTISRSGALHPGVLRTDGQQIGVNTPHGRHAPEALTAAGLQQLIDSTIRVDSCEAAIHLFVALAKAQPFEDGNKRTAIFAANALLIGSGSRRLLTIPDDQEKSFNDLLARAYIHGDLTGVADLLRRSGLVTR